MKTVINAIVIENKEILLVKKKNTWILPGGKIESKENELECVIREVSEELSGTRLKNINFYGEFSGITPHSKNQVISRAYFAKIDGNLQLPSQEILDSKYIKDFSSYNISDITMDIIDSLVKEKYL